MNLITQTLIEAVNWAALRTDSGSGAGLPQALNELLTATSQELAQDAYWRIDNEAIVQGELYEAAVPTLEVLLSAVSTVPPGAVRRSVAELIQQIVFGQPHSSEAEHDTGIASTCRTLASGALWVFYGWLTDEDDDVRQCALLTLCKIETNEQRKAVVLSAYRSGDPSPGVQKIFSEIDRGLY
jgi:hypothetical protein